jgi:hypothetical protein
MIPCYSLGLTLHYYEVYFYFTFYVIFMTPSTMSHHPQRFPRSSHSLYFNGRDDLCELLLIICLLILNTTAGRFAFDAAYCQ